MQDKFSYKNLCGKCNHKPCCVNFGSPVLFTGDLENLKEISKSDNNFVEETMIENKPFKTLRKKENSNICVFWDEKNTLCSIYEHRPYDCKMFPFDIDWIANEYRWIVYSCNPNSDWVWCEQHLKKLESDPQLDEMIESGFFRLNYKNAYYESPYTVLRPVNRNLFKV